VCRLPLELSFYYIAFSRFFWIVNFDCYVYARHLMCLCLVLSVFCLCLLVFICVCVCVCSCVFYVFMSVLPGGARYLILLVLRETWICCELHEIWERVIWRNRAEARLSCENRAWIFCQRAHFFPLRSVDMGDDFSAFSLDALKLADVIVVHACGCYVCVWKVNILLYSCFTILYI